MIFLCALQRSIHTSDNNVRHSQKKKHIQAPSHLTPSLGL